MNSMENTVRRVDQSQGSLHVTDHMGNLQSFDSGVEPSGGSYIALKVPALNMENLAHSKQFKINSLGSNQKQYDASSKRLPACGSVSGGGGSKRVFINKT